MMKKRGHEVIHYGHEDSNVDCSEHVTVVSRDLFKKVYTYDYHNSLFKWDEGDEVYRTFNANAIQEIGKRKRQGDFLLAFWGAGHRQICDAHQDMIVVEPGIGYAGGHFAPYKVWESYSIYHAYLGLGKVSNCFCEPKEWENDTIIPNYLDPDDFEFSKEKDDYFLFIGRVGFAKGLDSAIEMTRRLGKKLIVAGQNSEQGFKDISCWPVPTHVEVTGHVDVETRKRLLSKAKAVICFSKFVDPFCGVHAEALMSGTPVISSDWGVFTESIIHGINGFRCRTIEQLVKAGQKVHTIDPEMCREFAMRKFSCEAVTSEYEGYFKNILKKYKLYEPYTYSYLPLCPARMIDEIRSLYDCHAQKDGTIGADGVINNSRRVKVYWIPKTDQIYSILLNTILEENELRYGFNLSGTSENIQYTVYTGEDKGHYDWHIDAMKSCTRKLSAVVQLSDPSEYEGGELQIQNGGIHTVDKTKGTCVVFPSWMSHRVTPVTKGIRRTLVIWLEGPAFV
jgi:glycosyltransferase involved in cell wall biosynthesis